MSPRKATQTNLETVIPILADAVKNRKTREALKIVDYWSPRLATLPISERAGIPLLAYCAWAIDFGPYFDEVQEGVKRFKQIPVGELTLCELALLNTAEGLLKFHLEDHYEARALFEQVMQDADRGRCGEMMTVSRYYLGRNFWKQGEYSAALGFIRIAKDRDLALNNQARAAAIELVEAWLLFLKGEIEEAKRVLRDARARLGSETDNLLGSEADYLIELGNILSFQGRLHREAGEYQKALDCFAEAISVYEKHDHGHRNIARAHFNAGFVYSLQARNCSRQEPSKQEVPGVCEKTAELRGKAFEELTLAQQLYELDSHRNARGLGKIHNVRALLFFDADQLATAEEEAKKAFEYGKSKNDRIVMADARIIQSSLVLDGSRGFVDAKLALELAEEAFRYAEQTGNRRLRARAMIRWGFALLEHPNNDWDRAHQCWEDAQTQLIKEDRDYLRDSLETLEAALRAKKQASKTIVRLTALGVRGRRLKEVSAEAEEKVIRSVYEDCGHNVQLTARTLKAHQRKVRAAVSFFKITDDTLTSLSREGFSEEVMMKVRSLRNREIQGRACFVDSLRKAVANDYTDGLQSKILKYVQHRHLR